MKKSIMLMKISGDALGAGIFKRAIRRFRLPLRSGTDLEQTAAINRVHRLFEVNFRHSWTR